MGDLIQIQAVKTIQKIWTSFPICHICHFSDSQLHLALNHVSVLLSSQRFSIWSGYRCHAPLSSTSVLFCSPGSSLCLYVLEAAPRGLQKMQLTKPILHSTPTPRYSPQLHSRAHSLYPSLSHGCGCRQNARPVLRTTHRVIINKRRWQVNIPPEC